MCTRRYRYLLGDLVLPFAKALVDRALKIVCDASVTFCVQTVFRACTLKLNNSLIEKRMNS